MKITIKQGRSISPEEAEAMPQPPDFCACGSPIVTIYRNADGFCCMSCK